MRCAPNPCWTTPPQPPHLPSPCSRVVYGQRRRLPCENVMKKPWKPALAQENHSEEAIKKTKHLEPLRQFGKKNTNYVHTNGFAGPSEHIVRQHRQLPSVPHNTKNRQIAHQLSLPEEFSDAYIRESCSTRISSYLRPFVQNKPSSLPFRQSSMQNGLSTNNYFPRDVQQYQMPKVSDSPTVIGPAEPWFGMAGRAGEHRILPPVDRSHTTRRTLPQPPTSHKPPQPQPGNSFISDLFSRSSRDFDWI